MRGISKIKAFLPQRNPPGGEVLLGASALSTLKKHMQFADKSWMNRIIKLDRFHANDSVNEYT